MAALLDPRDQVIKHVDVGGRPAAYSTVGQGPPLVIGGWWCSHLELDFQDEAFRAFTSALAAHRTVVRYDPPGRGASGLAPSPAPTTLDAEVAVLTGVLDALGLDSAELLGASSGAPVVVALAAQQPARVRRLVLYGGFLRGQDIAPPDAREAMVEVIEGHWGLGARMLSDLFLPGADADERARFAEFQRRSATREVAAAALRSTYSFDASAHASAIGRPTLVVHRRDDRAIPVALGRELARTIPGAEYVELDGVDHLPWRGDAPALASAVLRFLGVRAEPPAPAPGPAPGQPTGLTQREAEVLALVAEGLTDAEIAERLHLSPHTVHRHVSNVRAKLGVRSRAAAAARWADRDT